MKVCEEMGVPKSKSWPNFMEHRSLKEHLQKVKLQCVSTCWMIVYSCYNVQNRKDFQLIWSINWSWKTELYYLVLVTLRSFGLINVAFVNHKFFANIIMFGQLDNLVCINANGEFCGYNLWNISLVHDNEFSTIF